MAPDDTTRGRADIPAVGTLAVGLCRGVSGVVSGVFDASIGSILAFVAQTVTGGGTFTNVQVRVLVYHAMRVPVLYGIRGF